MLSSGKRLRDRRHGRTFIREPLTNTHLSLRDCVFCCRDYVRSKMRMVNLQRGNIHVVSWILWSQTQDLWHLHCCHLASFFVTIFSKLIVPYSPKFFCFAYSLFQIAIHECASPSIVVFTFELLNSFIQRVSPSLQTKFTWESLRYECSIKSPKPNCCGLLGYSAYFRRSPYDYTKLMLLLLHRGSPRDRLGANGGNKT